MSFGMRNPKRRAAAAGRLGRLFLMRLEQGVMIDRTTKHADGKSRRKVAAPAALRISTKGVV